MRSARCAVKPAQDKARSSPSTPIWASAESSADPRLPRSCVDRSRLELCSPLSLALSPRGERELDSVRCSAICAVKPAQDKARSSPSTPKVAPEGSSAVPKLRLELCSPLSLALSPRGERELNSVRCSASCAVKPAQDKARSSPSTPIWASAESSVVRQANSRVRHSSQQMQGPRLSQGKNEGASEAGKASGWSFRAPSSVTTTPW